MAASTSNNKELLLKTKKLEEENRKLKKQLDQQNNILQKVLMCETLINTIPCPIFYKDTDLRYIGCNIAFAEQIVGQDIRKFIGLCPEELPGEIVSQEQAKKFREMDEKLLADPNSHQQYQCKIKCSDGVFREFVLYKAVYCDKKKPQGIIGVMLDISELTKAKNALDSMQNQLIQSQKMENIGRMASGVAHDFNNSLTIIIGNLQLLKMQMTTRDFGSIQAALHDMESSAFKASELTKKLLVFSRKNILQKETFDLNECLNELHRMLVRLLPEDIHLSFNSRSENLLIHADKNQIEQMIINLVVNARDAIEGSGNIIIETKQVTIGGQGVDSENPAKENYIRLRIKDDGSGIKPEILDKIFEPFFTTKETGKGTGLGLSVVYGIAKQHHGLINVESRPGRGSTFEIHLPKHEMTNIYQAPLNPLPGIEMGNGQKILVIEDNQSISSLLLRMLHNANYQAKSCQSAEKALELLQQKEESFDLLISDVVMSGMRGPALVAQCLIRYNEIKYILMSGHPRDIADLSVVDNRKVFFISKPFEIKDMFKLIKKALNSDN